MDLKASNDLEKYFLENEGRVIDKWWHYFEIYEDHFSKFRNKDVKILEIGVQNGGSTRMWKNYFGENALVVGIDIDERCKLLEEPGIEIRIGSQDDINFLNNIISEFGKFDVVIDDGGHFMHQQITSLNTLYPNMNEFGVYLCEDLHTSYWDIFNGGLNRKGTFMEYCKELIDKMNYQYCDEIQIDGYSKSIWSIHFYDSIVVFDKRTRVNSFHFTTGNIKIIT